MPLWSGWMINQKVNYIHANPVKGKLVKSTRDYYWSSFRSFYCQGDGPLKVDHDWWWPDDAEKLSKAMKELGMLVDARLGLKLLLGRGAGATLAPSRSVSYVRRFAPFPTARFWRVAWLRRFAPSPKRSQEGWQAGPTPISPKRPRARPRPKQGQEQQAGAGEVRSSTHEQVSSFLLLPAAPAYCLF
jgi:hypothetical protein